MSSTGSAPSATQVPFKPLGREYLRVDVTPRLLGFRPTHIWNPSPSRLHRIQPYRFPKALQIGMRGTEETGAKFSPPPYAVIVEGQGRQTFLGVSAKAGWHRWNAVDFAAGDDRVRITVDLEGRTPPATAARHVRVDIVPGNPGESRHQLLARGLSLAYPQAYRRADKVPAWWLRPIYCGWGDQVAAAMWMEGVGPERRALTYCLQGLYEKWIARLDEAGVPFGTVTIDAGWSPAGAWRVDEERWPDLRGFIARQHAKGRKVLLWGATWLWDGLPDEWCIFADGVKLTADPTNPQYRRYLCRQVAQLVSPKGYNADGFKIDQLAFTPTQRPGWGGPRFGWMRQVTPKTKLRLARDVWGAELLHLLQKDIYDAAKNQKPDALITSSTVHPYFHDTFDMVRLHDMGAVASDIFAAMKSRADLGRAALPHMPVDTDDWIHTDYNLWLKYTAGSGVLGVPCIFYASRFMKNWKGEPATQEIPLSDLKKIARAWKNYK